MKGGHFNRSCLIFVVFFIAGSCVSKNYNNTFLEVFHFTLDEVKSLFLLGNLSSDELNKIEAINLYLFVTEKNNDQIFRHHYEIDSIEAFLNKSFLAKFFKETHEIVNSINLDGFSLLLVFDFKSPVQYEIQAVNESFQIQVNSFQIGFNNNDVLTALIYEYFLLSCPDFIEISLSGYMPQISKENVCYFLKIQPTDVSGELNKKYYDDSIITIQLP